MFEKPALPGADELIPHGLYLIFTAPAFSAGGNLMFEKPVLPGADELIPLIIFSISQNICDKYYNTC